MKEHPQYPIDPDLFDDEEGLEEPEQHLANAEAAQAILETMILAGVGTLGALIERFPGMGMDAIQQELTQERTERSVEQP